MNTLRKMTAAAASVAAAGTVLFGLPSSAQAGMPGCTSGYACISRDVYSGGESPAVPLRYYDYGYYTLSNMFGNHLLQNNQTGYAKFLLCTDWYGNVCPTSVNPGTSMVADMTPFNSIRLKAA
jgi:hypothetical protein